MIRCALVLALAGCWSNAPHPPAHNAGPTPKVGSFPVPARALADPHIYEQLDHHAWITRFEHAWLRRDEPLNGRVGPGGQPRLFAVIDRRRDALRVVSTEDDARIAVWTALADVDVTIISLVELADDSGAIDPAHGVWLDPGVIIAAGAARPARHDRAIALVDQPVRATGFVGSDALGPVWIGAWPPAIESGAKNAALVAGAAIRVAPRPDARVLAKVNGGVDASATPSGAGWQEVDVRVRGIHVRGFVRTAELTQDHFIAGESVGGSDYGITDTDRLVVGPGACLFDRKRGEVIGVNTKTRNRYAFDVGLEWPMVFVDTPWESTLVAVHDLAPGGSAPQLESCWPKSDAVSDR